MIYKANPHPVKTSGYSSSASSCHVMVYCPALSIPTKIAPIQNWHTPLVKILNYLSLVLEFSIPHPAVLNIFQLALTGDKKNVNLVFFLRFSTLLSPSSIK